MQQRESGLWIPPAGMNFHEYRKTTRTVTLDSGARAKWWVDDSGTVMQVESGDRLDAVVRPKTVRIKVRRMA